MIMKIGDERCVLHKLNGSLFSLSRYKVQLSDAYPVNPVRPSAEPLTADCQNENTDSKSVVIYTGIWDDLNQNFPIFNQ